MKAGEIKVYEGWVYQSRLVRRGELLCENCAAVDGAKHDYDLCEALLPCREFNLSIVWERIPVIVENGTAGVYMDTQDAIKAYDESNVAKLAARRGSPTVELRFESANRKECTALVLRPKRWLVWVEQDSDTFAEAVLCDKCMQRITPKLDSVDAEYNIETMPHYYGCDICKDGIGAYTNYWLREVYPLMVDAEELERKAVGHA